LELFTEKVDHHITQNMIADVHPLIQTFLGTLFTWGLTALGSALVFVFNSGQVKTVMRFKTSILL